MSDNAKEPVSLPKTYHSGLVMGKFAPLHKGHKRLIDQALKRCVTLLVVLCYDQRWVNQQDWNIQHLLTLGHRMRALENFARQISIRYDLYEVWNERKIVTAYVDATPDGFTPGDDSPVPGSPDSLREFCCLAADKVFNKLAIYPEAVFTSDPSNIDEYRKRWPHKERVLIEPDPKYSGVSSEDIRKRMVKVEEDQAAIRGMIEYEL